MNKGKKYSLKNNCVFSAKLRTPRSSFSFAYSDKTTGMVQIESYFYLLGLKLILGRTSWNILIHFRLGWIKEIKIWLGKEILFKLCFDKIYIVMKLTLSNLLFGFLFKLIFQATYETIHLKCDVRFLHLLKFFYLKKNLNCSNVDKIVIMRTKRLWKISLNLQPFLSKNIKIFI